MRTVPQNLSWAPSSAGTDLHAHGSGTTDRVDLANPDLKALERRERAGWARRSGSRMSPLSEKAWRSQTALPGLRMTTTTGYHSATTDIPRRDGEKPMRNRLMRSEEAL